MKKTTILQVFRQKFAVFYKKNLIFLASFNYISYFCQRFI